MGGGAPTYTTSQTMVVPVLKVRQPRFVAEDSLDWEEVRPAMAANPFRAYFVEPYTEEFDCWNKDDPIRSATAKVRT